jgi:hypothetical protein
MQKSRKFDKKKKKKKTNEFVQKRVYAIAFYSHVQDVPLIVFGTINLLFGIVTLCSMGLFLIRVNVILNV